MSPGCSPLGPSWSYPGQTTIVLFQIIYCLCAWQYHGLSLIITGRKKLGHYYNDNTPVNRYINWNDTMPDKFSWCGCSAWLQSVSFSSGKYLFIVFSLCSLGGNQGSTVNITWDPCLHSDINLLFSPSSWTVWTAAHVLSCGFALNYSELERKIVVKYWG